MQYAPRVCTLVLFCFSVANWSVCYVTDVIDPTGDSDGEAVVGAAFYATRSMGVQASSDESSDGTLSSKLTVA